MLLNRGCIPACCVHFGLLRVKLWNPKLQFPDGAFWVKILAPREAGDISVINVPCWVPLCFMEVLYL